MDDELLAAIAADPADDAPRLVLADVLTQRGDPWGELIVISCELAPHERGEQRWTARARELATRRDELVKARFSRDGFDFVFERGFCHEVMNEHGDLARLDEPAFALIDTVTLGEASAERLQALARWWRLARVRKLHVWAADQPLQAAVMQVIQYAHGLTTLEVSGVDFDRGALAELFAIPHAARLRRLAISSCPELGAALAGLRWPYLEELELRADGVQRSDVDVLLTDEAIRGLRVLDLSFNYPLDGPVADALARCPFERLERLGFLGNTIDGPAVAHLLAGRGMQNLTTLAIGDLRSSLAGALPAFAALPRLAELKLRSGRQLRGLAALARPYRELDLHVPKLEATELADLLAQPALRSLRRLALRLQTNREPRREPGEPFAQAIAAAHLPELASLTLDGCNLREAGARTLLRSELDRDLSLALVRDEPGAALDELRARFSGFTTYR